MGIRKERKERAAKRISDIKIELLNGIDNIRKLIDMKYDIKKTEILEKDSEAGIESIKKFNIFYRIILKQNPTERHLYRKAFSQLNESAQEFIEKAKETEMVQS